MLAEVDSAGDVLVRSVPDRGRAERILGDPTSSQLARRRTRPYATSLRVVWKDSDLDIEGKVGRLGVNNHPRNIERDAM